MVKEKLSTLRDESPDQLIGVTESGEAFLGLTFALVVFATLVLSFVITTC